MKIKAQIVADSKNEFGNRITTFVLTYPRIIHAEFMTHRMFSRNAASSRAVPARKLIEAVKNDPFIPIAWQKQHSGMQGSEYISDPNEIEFEIRDWLIDRDYVVKKAEARLNRGVTKQIVNRPLELFQYYTCICTATEWENFFALRCPKYEVKRIKRMEIYSFDPLSSGISGVSNDMEARYYRSKKDLLKENAFEQPMTDLQWLQINESQAEIHMMALAEAMWNVYNESTPKQLQAGEWHIPFGDKFDQDQLHEAFFPSNPDELETMNNEWKNLKIKIATARCARVSYTVVGEEGKPDNYKKDIELHDRLAASGHWSPFEHCALAMNNEEYANNERREDNDNGAIMISNGWSGNFRGFIQYRKRFQNENITI